MMVMTLCLMVYNAGQYQVRKALEVQQDSCLAGLYGEEEKIIRLFGEEVCRVYKLV